MSRPMNQSRRPRTTSPQAQPRRPFVEYLEDRQLLDNGLANYASPVMPVFMASVPGILQIPSVVMLTTQQGGDSYQNWVDQNLGAGALDPNIPNHHVPTPVLPKGHGVIPPEPVIHPKLPPIKPPIIPVMDPPTISDPIIRPVPSGGHKVPIVRLPPNPGVPILGGHPTTPVSSKPTPPRPAAHTTPAKPVKTEANDGTVVAMTRGNFGPVLPGAPTAMVRPSLPTPASDDGDDDDADDSPQRAGRSTPATSPGPAASANVVLFVASAAPGTSSPLGSAGETAAASSHIERGSVDAAHPPVAGQTLARSDAPPPAAAKDAARLTALVHEQPELVEELNRGSAQTNADLQAVAGALLDGSLGQGAATTLRKEYAVAASSVLAQDAGAGANGSSAAGVTDRGAEWGFLLGWALAMPPGRMKHQPTIMVVESDESARDAMTIKLVQEGFLVLPAGSGRDAMNVLRAPLSPIDIMVLDMHLPDVSGIHLFERLSELYATLPVAVWMGDPHVARDTGHFRNLGMQYYLPKPIEMDRLVTTIRGLLG